MEKINNLLTCCRRAIRCVAAAAMMTVSGNSLAQTVSVSPTTGNVISASSYDTESHVKNFGGTWLHDQLPLTLITSDEATLTESGLMKVHANNVAAQDGKLTIISGQGETLNHMSLSLPKGYRFTSYKMVLNSGSGATVATTLKETNATFGTTHEQATVNRTGSTNVTMQRTSLNSDDMGNILYFLQDHADAGQGNARVDIVSFVVTFECTDKFNAILRPDADRLTSPVACLAMPFLTQRVDLGKIEKSTDEGYTSYKYNYENVKDLEANFLFYNQSAITGGTAVPGATGDGAITALKNYGERTFLGLKDGTYWLETPTDALAQDNTTHIPVGYRIVGTRVVYANTMNPDIKRGSEIFITDGNGLYMNAALTFTDIKTEWSYGTDGKVSTTSGGGTVYLRHKKSGLFFPTYSLATTGDESDASAFNTDGMTLYYGSGSSSRIISCGDDLKACYNNQDRYAIVLNANATEGSDNSFTIRLYGKDGTTVAKEAKVSRDKPNGDLVLGGMNNDAVKIEIEGLSEGQQAYVCMEVQLEALNPYIDKMDISCTEPSGNTTIKNQYLADDFTIGADGKVDFAVPTNFGATGLRFAFEGLHHKSADETYPGGAAGNYSRYHFVKSAYYNLIGENLQGHRAEAADCDWAKKTAVGVAGDKAFLRNNSGEFKAGTSGDETFTYKEYRYSNAEYENQGGHWTEMTANSGDGYTTRHIIVCDETRYNIAPTTTPRHASYAYYSTDLRLTTEDYQPELVYAKVYDNAVTQSGFDASPYSGVTVTLKKADGTSVTDGTGYVYAKQVLDQMKADIAAGKANAPADTRHILYLDASNVSSLLYSDTDTSWGNLKSLKSELAPNALVYLPSGVTDVLDNVATKSLSADDFVADNDIVLTDQQPFFAPHDIRVNAANEVSYTRIAAAQHEPTQWVTMMLPFTVAVDSETGTYEDGNDGNALTFHEINTTNTFSDAASDDRLVHEATAHFHPLTGTYVTTPNAPYVVYVDKTAANAAESSALFTVRQRGATIVKTPTSADNRTIAGGEATGTVRGSSMTITNHATYSGVSLPKQDETFYFNRDKFISSLLLDERYDDVLVMPFRSYYMCGDNSARVRRIGISTESNSEPTAIDNAATDGRTASGFAYTPEKGQLTVTADRNICVTVRGISGQTIDCTRLKAGGTHTLPLPSGIYVVNGTKVVVK